MVRESLRKIGKSIPIWKASRRALEHVLVVRALEGEDPLVPEEVRALGLHELTNPAVQAPHVDVALEGRGARGHLP